MLSVQTHDLQDATQELSSRLPTDVRSQLYFVKYVPVLLLSLANKHQNRTHFVTLVSLCRSQNSFLKNLTELLWELAVNKPHFRFVCGSVTFPSLQMAKCQILYFLSHIYLYLPLMDPQSQALKRICYSNVHCQKEQTPWIHSLSVLKLWFVSYHTTTYAHFLVHIHTRNQRFHPASLHPYWWFRIRKQN